MNTDICGILHKTWGDSYECILPEGHEEAHEYTDNQCVSWRWETDWACECEWCRKAEGDYCTIYWRKLDE